MHHFTELLIEYTYNEEIIDKVDAEVTVTEQTRKEVKEIIDKSHN